MQSYHAGSRRTATRHPFRWQFVLVPASLISVVSVPVLVSGQRGGRNSPWGSARIFRSAPAVPSSGQGRLYEELPRDSPEINSMNQRSVQQLDEPHVSTTRTATYSSTFSQSSQPTWPGVVSSAAPPSTPAVARTQTGAEANSYSFRGAAPSTHLSSSAPSTQARPSSPSSGFTGIAPVAPRSDRNAIFEGFSGDPVLPRNNAPRLAPEGTPHRTQASSYSVNVTSPLTRGERLYATYTERAGTAHEAEGRPANGLILSPTAEATGGNTRTPSAFSPTTFSSGGGSEVSALSPFGTTVPASLSAFTFTPWGSTTRSEVLVDGEGGSDTGRSSTTFQSNFVETVNSGRHWTVATPQNMSPSPPQRLWPTESSSGAPRNENYQLSNSVQPGRLVPSPSSADVMYTGTGPRQPGSNGSSSVMPSRSSGGTELSSFGVPSSQLRPALDGSRQHGAQPGSERVTRNATMYTSVPGDSVSSSVRVSVETPDNEEGTTLTGTGDSTSVAISPIGQVSSQQEYRWRPLDSCTRSTSTKAPNEYRLSPTLRDGDPPTLLADEPSHSPSARDTSGTSVPASPCQLLQGIALLEPDNYSRTNCVQSDGAERVETTAVPSFDSTPMQKDLPAEQQPRTGSSHGNNPAEDRVRGPVRDDNAQALGSNHASLATEENPSELRARTVAPQDGDVLGGDGTSESTDSDHVRVGYIPPEALTASSAGAEGQDAETNTEQLLYGDLAGYTVDAEDPWVKSLAALGSQEGDVNISVTTTSTATTQTYPPFYNPYNDNLDVDDIPDSPYHNYKWAVDPFPSTYSTHSRLENYESEFNNRYYHEEKTAPNITWEEYTRRRSEVEDARKREADLQTEGRVGLIESSDALFQGLIGYPTRGRMSRSPS